MDWAMRVMEVAGYPGVAAVMLLETVFPVIPSEVTLPFIGFLTTSHGMTLFGAVIASTLGAVVGALILYSLSRFGSDSVDLFVDRFGRRLGIHRAEFNRAERWFERFGVWAVFLCRMVPVARCLISVPAGITKMPVVPFVVYTAVGSFLWNLGLIWCGAVLGSAWEKVGSWVDVYAYILFGVGVVAFILYSWRKRTKH